MMLLALAMLALLPVLAVLQYRWLSEVSRAESERMRANLENSVAQFGRDFDQELTSAYIVFQNDPFSGRGIVASYRQWRETARHPNLVSAVFQTRMTDDGQCHLVKFNEAAGDFEPVEWPQPFLTLRDSLIREQQHQRQAEEFLFNTMDVFRRRMLTRETDAGAPAPPAGGNGPRVRIQQTVRPAVIQASIRSVDPDIPALLIPILSHSEDFTAGRPMFPMAQRIVLLDETYLKREMIPALIRRHFTGAEAFNIAIAKRADPKAIVYESSPGASAAGGEVAGELLKLRLNDVGRALIADLPKHDAGSAPPKGGKSARSASIILQSDIQMGAESPIGVFSGDGPPRLNLSDQGGWRIAVRHRAGSLEAAVGSVRRRNLAISFGILLLLGVSVGFIVLSSRRAQRLAEQQMEFVAGVSHELRTPLAVICSAAENLADGVVDNREQIQRYGGLIRDEGRRLSGMVEQVLEFAGAQSGKKTYDLKPADLRGVVEDALAACQLQIAEGGFELETQLAATLPPIQADAPALSRALQNLLGNAMKYSGDSRWIGLRAEAAGEGVEIQVSDRGLGIAASELPHIFEPFYRGPEVVAAQIHGNGLGLSLVRHIIEAHHGSVRVESEPQRGSTFRVWLPATAHEPVAPVVPGVPRGMDTLPAVISAPAREE